MLRASTRFLALAAASVVTLSTTLTMAAGGKPTGGAGKTGADPKLEEAKQHMAAGSAFYNDPSGHKCEEAISEFQKAYELSGSWKALRAMAICELQLERDGLAIDHYEEVLKRGGDQIDPTDRGQIQSDLAALRSAVATLEVTANVPAARLVATRQPSSGATITNRYTIEGGKLRVRIHPGQYAFTAQADEMPDVAWQAEVKNGSSVAKSLEFKKAEVKPVEAPPPPPKKDEPAAMERPIPATVWIFTGLTGACAVTSGTFMGLAASAKSDFDAKNGAAPRADLEDLRSDVVTKNLVADVALGATVASAGATVIFYLLRPEVPASREASVDWTIVPVVGPELAGASIGGRF